MAKLMEVKPPTKPTYVVEFTQEEFDLLGGLVNDVGDRNRGVVLQYRADGDSVKPNKESFEIFEGLQGIFSQHMDVDYDYFDYWDTVSE